MTPAAASKLLNFKQAIADARRRNGGDIRSFVAKINAAAGETGIATRSLLNSIERHGARTLGEKRLLAWICDFTFCEALGRPFTRTELLALNQGDLTLEDLRSVPSAAKMQERPHCHSASMSDLPPDLPKLPSFISGVLLDLMETPGLDRDAIAAALGVTRDRVEALIATRTPISPDEYTAIAALMNQHRQKREREWTAATLQAAKAFWDRDTGKVNNGDEVS